MAGRKKPKFECIKHDRPIEVGTDDEFLALLHTALLAAIQEKGIIDFTEYRNAEEILKQKGSERGLNL